MAEIRFYIWNEMFDFYGKEQNHIHSIETYDIIEYEMIDGKIYKRKDYYGSGNNELYYCVFIKNLEDNKSIFRIKHTKRTYFLKNGTSHSTTNPAIITENDKYYYINGKIINKTDWLRYNRKEKFKRLLYEENK